MTENTLCFHLCIDQRSSLAQRRVFAFPFTQAQLNLWNAIDGLLQSRSCFFSILFQVVRLCQTVQIAIKIANGAVANIQAEGLQGKDLFSRFDNSGCLVDSLECSYI